MRLQGVGVLDREQFQNRAWLLKNDRHDLTVLGVQMFLTEP